MYYLNKNDQFYYMYLKNGYMTTMMPDTCTLYTRIAQKELIKILISIVVLFV